MSTSLDQVAALTACFGRTFGSDHSRPFGSARGQHEGVSDDAKGVQWNAGVDRERHVVTLGVNLEGLQYDDWPIARLIERELDGFRLLDVVSRQPSLAESELWFSRDAWQISTRPAIVEQWLGGAAPVPLSELTRSRWKSILVEAYACLNASKGRRARARQEVTLIKKGKTAKDVSPHLQIKRVLQLTATQGSAQMLEAMGVARDLLMPVREWAIDASRL